MKILKDQPLVEESAKIRKFIEATLTSNEYLYKKDLHKFIILPMLDIIDTLIAGVIS